MAAAVDGWRRGVRAERHNCAALLRVLLLLLQLLPYNRHPAPVDPFHVPPVLPAACNCRAR